MRQEKGAHSGPLSFVLFGLTSLHEACSCGEANCFPESQAQKRLSSASSVANTGRTMSRQAPTDCRVNTQPYPQPCFPPASPSYKTKASDCFLGRRAIHESSEDPTGALQVVAVGEGRGSDDLEAVLFPSSEARRFRPAPLKTNA